MSDEPDAMDEVRLDWPFTQSELAAMIGGTRQTVNRLLADFVDQDLIRFEKDTLVIPNVDAAGPRRRALTGAAGVWSRSPPPSPPTDAAAIEALAAVGLRAEAARRMRARDRRGRAPVGRRGDRRAVRRRRGLDRALRRGARPARLPGGCRRAGPGRRRARRSPPTRASWATSITTGQALALSDVDRATRGSGARSAEQTGYVPRSIVAVPLVDEHGTVGVLEVLDKRDARRSRCATSSWRRCSRGRPPSPSARAGSSASRPRSSTRAPRRPGGADATDRDDRRSSWPAAVADLDRDDAGSSGRLVEQRRPGPAADPDQLALVADLLEVLADHAERRRGGRLDPPG